MTRSILSFAFASILLAACGDDGGGTGTSTGSSTGAASSSGGSSSSSTAGSTSEASSGPSTSEGSGSGSTGTATGTSAADSSGGGTASGSSGGSGASSGGPVCADVDESCTVAQCCDGLECCAGVPIPPGSEYCSAGPCPISDRNRKREFASVDPAAILAEIVRLPITTWSYKHEDAAIRHIGPMAQDFKAAFGVGATDKMIFQIDADGVALVGVQALHDRVVELEAENDALRGELAGISARLASLEAQR